MILNKFYLKMIYHLHYAYFYINISCHEQWTHNFLRNVFVISVGIDPGLGKLYFIMINQAREIPQYPVLVLKLTPINTVSFNMIFLIPQNQCYPGTPCITNFEDVPLGLYLDVQFLQWWLLNFSVKFSMVFYFCSCRRCRRCRRCSSCWRCS